MAEIEPLDDGQLTGNISAADELRERRQYAWVDEEDMDYPDEMEE